MPRLGLALVLASFLLADPSARAHDFELAALPPDVQRMLAQGREFDTVTEGFWNVYDADGRPVVGVPLGPDGLLTQAQVRELVHWRRVTPNSRDQYRGWTTTFEGMDLG